jgi:hypothetical protein
MAKLKAIKSRLAVLPGRVKRGSDADGHSRVFEPWRNWYSLKAWAVLRQEVFARDEFVCQCGCETLIASPANASPTTRRRTEATGTSSSIPTTSRRFGSRTTTGGSRGVERAARSARG